MKDSRSQHDFFDWLLICAGLFWLPMWMIAILKQKVLEVSHLDDYKGVKIYDPTVYRDKFNAVVIEALQLVEDADPRRFRRIQRNCKRILHAFHPAAAASYIHRERLCLIDFRKWIDFDEETVAFSLAITIVHEATHGAIESRGVRYTKKNRLRIERLCHIEETRFTRCVMPDYERPPFDAEPHQANYTMKFGERLSRAASTLKAAHMVNRTARLEKDYQ